MKKLLLLATICSSLLATAGVWDKIKVKGKKVNYKAAISRQKAKVEAQKREALMRSQMQSSNITSGVGAVGARSIGSTSSTISTCHTYCGNSRISHPCSIKPKCAQNSLSDSPFIRGCTDPKASNFNPKAKHNNGSCTYSQTGYTGAARSLGSTVAMGCKDPQASNYNPKAISHQASACTYDKKACQTLCNGSVVFYNCGGQKPACSESTSKTTCSTTCPGGSIVSHACGQKPICPVRVPGAANVSPSF